MHAAYPAASNQQLVVSRIPMMRAFWCAVLFIRALLVGIFFVEKCAGVGGGNWLWVFVSEREKFDGSRWQELWNFEDNCHVLDLT